MEVSEFKILLIDITFYLWHVQKLVFIVVIKKWKKLISSGPAVKGLSSVCDILL